MDFGLTTMRADAHFTDKELCSLYHSAGFKYIDYYFSKLRYDNSYFDNDKNKVESYYKDLREYAGNVGIYFHQTHAPYPTYVGNKKTDRAIIDKLKLSIMASSVLGARYSVVHPQMPKFSHLDICRKKRKQINIAYYQQLIPYLEKYNITLAIENMFHSRCNKLVKTVCSMAEEMIDIQDALNHPLITLCVDIGHANIIYKDSGIDMLKSLGSRVKVLHIHDNNSQKDQHLTPGLGNIAWDKVVTALREISYNGVINLECHGSIIKNNKDNISTHLSKIHSTASHIFRDFFNN